jgi:hypothetical protein
LRQPCYAFPAPSQVRTLGLCARNGPASPITRRRFLSIPLEAAGAAAGMTLLGRSSFAAGSHLKIQDVETWFVNCNSIVIVVRTEEGITAHGECSKPLTEYPPRSKG